MCVQDFIDASRGKKKSNPLPKPGPTPPPVQMQSAEQAKTKRTAKRNLLRTQSIFAGENKQTLG